MADEKIDLKVIIETAKSEKDITKLNSTLDKLQKSLEGVDEASSEYAKTQEAINAVTAQQNEVFVENAIVAAKSASNMKELTKAMKDLKSAQEKVDKSSPNFKKVQKAITDTEGRVGDLNDSFKTLTGSGMERFKSSLSLVGEGISNLDFGKFKTGIKGATTAFGGLKTALASLGIGLIIQAITYLISNFDELKNSTGLIGTVFRGIGDIISFVTDKISEFTDALGITNNAIEKQSAKTIEAAKKQQETLTERYDKEIELAKAAGKNTTKLEKEKQIAILKTLDVQLKAIIAVAKANGHWTKEQIEQVQEIGKLAADASQQLKLVEINDIKEKTEKSKKANEEKTKDNQKYLDEIKNQQRQAAIDAEKDEIKKAEIRKKFRDEDINASKTSEEVKNAALIQSKLEFNKEVDKIFADADSKELEDKKKQEEELGRIADKAILDEAARKKKQAEDDIKLAEETEKKKQEAQKKTFAMAQQLAQDTMQIVSLVNDIQNQKRDQDLAASNAATEEKLDTMNSAKDAELNKEGVTAEEKISIANKYAMEEYAIKLKQYNENLAVKKKEFENGKKMAIASALIAGAVAAVNSLSAAPFFPMAIIGLAMATITTALSVAKIQGQKFDGGGSPPKPPTLQTAAGSSGMSGGNSKNQTTFLPPNLQKVGRSDVTNPNAPKSNGSSDKKQPIEAYVVTESMTKSQNMNNVIERRRSF